MIAPQLNEEKGIELCEGRGGWIGEREAFGVYNHWNPHDNKKFCMRERRKFSDLFFVADADHLSLVHERPVEVRRPPEHSAGQS